MNRSRVKLVLETTVADSSWKEVTHVVLVSESEASAVAVVFDNLVQFFDTLKRTVRMMT